MLTQPLFTEYDCFHTLPLPSDDNSVFLFLIMFLFRCFCFSNSVEALKTRIIKDLFCLVLRCRIFVGLFFIVHGTGKGGYRFMIFL